MKEASLGCEISSFRELMDAIHKRPGMYLGGDPQHRREQLQNLEHLVLGYELAARMHDVDPPAQGVWERFSAHLAQRFAWSMSSGPVAAVLDATDSEDAAWDLFWQQLIAFLATRAP